MSVNEQLMRGTMINRATFLNGAKTSVVAISRPVTWDGKTYSSLTLREPVVGDVVLTDKVEGEMAKNVALLAAITDTSIPVIQGLSLADFKKLGETAAPFLADVAGDEPAAGLTPASPT